MTIGNKKLTKITIDDKKGFFLSEKDIKQLIKLYEDEIEAAHYSKVIAKAKEGKLISQAQAIDKIKSIIAGN